MTNISHTPGRFPTNDPYLWAWIATLAILALTPDAERMGRAIEGAFLVVQSVHLLRRPGL